MTGSQAHPRYQSSSESTVVVTGYDRTVVSEPDDSGIALVSTVLREEFSGGLAGTGTAEHVRVAHANGDDSFTGIERFSGTLDGRAGSFALTAEGYTTGGVVRGYWHVIPGSATGELAGLRGHGVFTAAPTPHRPGTDNHYGTATDCLTYWFED
jgi:hypothetical protein